MHLHVFPYATQCTSRQPTVGLRSGRELHKCANRIQTRTRMNIHVRCIARDNCHPIRRSNKCRTAVTSAGNQERSANICSVLVPEEIEISFEEFPQADTGLQRPIIQQEGPARGAVCAQDALVGIDGQQNAYELPLRGHYGDDPLSMELLSKKSLFYCDSGLFRKSPRQCMCSFRKFRIDGRYVQDCC